MMTSPAMAEAGSDNAELHDSHFPLTNYIQEGTDIRDFLEIMGDTVGRVALFGIPLQQTWAYSLTNDYTPSYYLQSDAPLYYYSFTDAVIASACLSLSPQEQARFDPMITGFNPADMYGVEHIKRVLKTFPGVFSGIGEFTIHKEFDISRKSRKKSLTFGVGRHYCLGAALARLELTIVIELLLLNTQRYHPDIERLVVQPAPMLTRAIKRFPIRQEPQALSTR